MSLPTKPLTAYRITDVRFGETIQDVAARELGDAERWAELVAINELRPPFVTSDPDLKVPGVLLAGDPVKIPAPRPFIVGSQDPEDIFLRDVELDGKRLTVENGDISLVSGVANLRQALNHAVITERGEMLYHPRYGSMIPKIIGEVNGPVATVLAAQYAKSVVEADPRIAAVTYAEADTAGDQIVVRVIAETVYGRPIDLQVSM